MATKPSYQIPSDIWTNIVHDYQKWMTLKDLSKKYSLGQNMIFLRLQAARIERNRENRPSKAKKKPLANPTPEKQVKPKKINIATPNGHFNVNAFDKVAGRGWVF